MRNKQKFREKRNFSNYFLSLKSNKRGLSVLADIVFSLILFTAFFVILTIIAGTASMQVHATIQSANTKFVCQNDLSSAMQFPYEDEQIKDILLREYVKNEKVDVVEDEITKTYLKLDKFKSEIKKIFNNVPGEDKWSLQLLQYENIEALEPTELFKTGEITNDKETETCSVFIPVPCDIIPEKCIVEAKLTLSYEK